MAGPENVGTILVFETYHIKKQRLIGLSRSQVDFGVKARKTKTITYPGQRRVIGLRGTRETKVT